VTLPPLDFRRKELVSQVVPPHPAPEVPARAAAPGEIPPGAARVIKAAEAAGWEVRPTYARGTDIDRKGHAKGLIHSLAVRMRLPGARARAVAVWTSPAVSGGPMKWKSDGAYAWTVGGLAQRIPLTGAGKLTLGLHLANPSRLTYTSTDC
jgi:hypothetical protein